MGENSAVFSNIRGRRSVRKFAAGDVPLENLRLLVEAGSYAPSGHNNQPWGFIIIKSEEAKERIAGLTAYGKIVRSSAALIAVFFDHERSYDRDKDMMAVGACIQNMLLAAHAEGIGGVWLGEILKNKDAVREICGAGDRFELAAVIALGVAAAQPVDPGRRPVAELVMRELV